jgi:5-carboxymethyl-2-hydroxymuconate isomerase
MRTPLAVFASAVVVSAATLWSTANDKVTAWRRLDAEIGKLRPLVVSPQFSTSLDANDEAIRNRVAELDAALDARVSSWDFGAAWLWSPSNREAVSAILGDVRPALDELVYIADQRRASQPLPYAPRLLRVRHRVNLLCASALFDTDDLEARSRFLQAWRVATMEDDGGIIAAMLQMASGQIVADAIRRRADRFGVRDEVLQQELLESFRRAFTCDANIERSARDLINFADRRNRDDVEMWAVKAALRAAPNLYATLTGAMSFESLRQHDEQYDLRLFLSNCDPERLAVYERNLRF